MPSLKYVNCSIELSDSQQTLQEFGTSYGDGVVETFVPVPSKSMSFSVHLTSDKFIAPGIAMYVFIDGVYQCNRNRQDLRLRKAADSRSLVDFRVRQKEEKQKDGSMIAREWKFEKLNTVSADEASHDCSQDLLANIGCIEVVVLRCAGPRTAKTVSQMNMDGANDVPDHTFGFDGQYDETSSDSIYDDRLPFANNQGNSFGPPPPLGVYQPPYAETIYSRAPTRSNRTTHSVKQSTHPSHRSSHAQSRYPGPLTPGVSHPSEVPFLGVQYGSGPLPPVGEPFLQAGHNAPVPNASSLDPQWLDKIVTQAVKKGVEESQRNTAPVEANAGQSQQNHNIESASQPPGAWPISPYGITAQPGNLGGPDQPAGERGTAWGQSQGGWTQRLAQSKAGTRVTWHDADSTWESTSSATGWSTQKDMPTDSWDTDETWAAKESGEWRGDDRKGRSLTTHNRSRRNPRPVSPITIRIRDQRRSKDGVSLRLRSKSRSRHFSTDADTPSSSDNKCGWKHNDTISSDAEQSSDDTLQPSHSQSQLKTLRSRSRKPSHRSRSTRIIHRRPSGQGTAVQDWQTRVNAKSASPVYTSPIPAVMNPPVSVHAPSNSDFVQGPLPPAQYAPTAPVFTTRRGDPDPFETQSTFFSSWGSNEKAKKEDGFWGPATKNKDGWDTVDGQGKVASGWKDHGKATSVTEKPMKNVGAGRWVSDDNAWGPEPIATAPSGHKKKFSWGHLHAKKAAQHKTDTPWKIAPAEDKPVKAASTSMRHSNKTLAKYRQLRSAPDTGPKPHWQFPPPPPEKKIIPLPENNGPYIAPKEPLLTVSKEAASEKGIEHQVRAGEAMQYGHIVGHPEYLDRLDEPYAVFRFKYRSRSILQSLFGDTLVPSHGTLTVPTPSSNLAKAKDKLKHLPQDELVEKMLGLQTRLAEKGYTRDERVRSEKKRGDRERRACGSESQQTEVVARGLTEKWVDMQSREVSEKGRGGKSGKREGAKRKKRVQGWGQARDVGGWEGEKW